MRELGHAPSLVMQPAAPLRNLHACFVFESQECVIDLVRNLRCLDPDSQILLYDASADGRLLEPRSCFDKLGAVLHPAPRPLAPHERWSFALDCMRFARDNLSFDTLTIVDGDQLASRPGWSERLSTHLAGQADVGLCASGSGGGAPEPEPASTRLVPGIAAWQELALWRPLLGRFAPGEQDFPRWAAWPGSVFTSAAACELASWFERDPELSALMERSRIPNKEEIVFSTLLGLLGFRLLSSPSHHAYVRPQVSYDPGDAAAALGDPAAFWIYPVARRYDDASRRAIRHHFAQYRTPNAMPSTYIQRRTLPRVDDELRQPILRRMRDVDGWLSASEATLLIAATEHALRSCPEAGAIVEVGSYCGRATTVLGCVVRAVRATSRVFAIDPHDGFVGALDHGLERVGPTLERLCANIARAELSPFVEIVQARAVEVPWSEPVCLLLIDGWHDYPSVLRDFNHFERYLVDNALVAFHDYAEYFPGVPAFVDELAVSGRYEVLGRAQSLIVLRKLPGLPAGAQVA